MPPLNETEARATGSRMNQKRIDTLAKRVWDYMRLKQTPAPADCILVFGSHDPRVAKYGADLFLRKLAPLILFSGKAGTPYREVEND